jgi:hypothetical protein
VEVLIPITLFVCIAAVAIFRPITKQLGGLLEAMARQRTEPPATDRTDARVVALLEQMSRRMELIEERLDFTERLVSSREPDSIRQINRRSVSVSTE